MYLFFIGDRYDKDPKPKSDFDDFDGPDYQRKSKLGEIKDKIGQKFGELRPGRRDYRDYYSEHGNGAK